MRKPCALIPIILVIQEPQDKIGKGDNLWQSLASFSGKKKKKKEDRSEHWPTWSCGYTGWSHAHPCPSQQCRRQPGNAGRK